MNVQFLSLSIRSRVVVRSNFVLWREGLLLRRRGSRRDGGWLTFF